MKNILINKLYDSAGNGTNETFITKMNSGFLLMGYQQFLPGYVVLFADPPAASLNDLSLKKREIFLKDMSIAGDAVLRCTDAYRINYEILGNESPVLHAHIFPRYLYEEESFRKGPVWLYGERKFNSVMFNPEKDKDLLNDIKSQIKIKK